jgi:hypothetical protein
MRDGRRLVFVGGPPRSGTTLVQNVLDSHPDILGTPELLHLPEVLRLRARFLDSVDRSFLEFFCDRAGVDRAMYGFMERFLGPVLESCDLTYVSEKTPSNALVFAELHELLPRAKFVFVVRDPRAIVSSMQRIGARARAKGLRTPSYASDTRDAVREVKRHLSAGFAFARSQPGLCFTVRYEDLTTRPADVTRELCDFLELEWSESMLWPEKYPHAGERSLTREGLWYESAEFNRALSPDRNEAWREEFDAGQQIFVTNAFREHAETEQAGYALDLAHLRGLRGLGARMEWASGAVLRRIRRAMTPP